MKLLKDEAVAVFNGNAFPLNLIQRIATAQTPFEIVIWNLNRSLPPSDHTRPNPSLSLAIQGEWNRKLQSGYSHSRHEPVKRQGILLSRS